jgi:hypothetical protein
MIMKKHLIALVLAASGVLSSCVQKDNSLVFEISNNSGHELSKIEIYAMMGSKTQSLITRESLSNVNTVKESAAQNMLPRPNDGGYAIIYKANSQQKTTRFGYFSNGSDFNGKYTLEVFRDSVRVRSIPKDL